MRPGRRPPCFLVLGWCRRGGRLHAKVPHGHWKTLTFVAALRGEGIDAPCVFDGPINGESFKAYVEQGLAPALRPGGGGVMDNLGPHKGSAIRRAIRAAGARHLFLPPYSPDLDPIEQAFAKLKTLIRKAKSVPSLVSGGASAVRSKLSRPENAPTTSATPDRLLLKSEKR
jgi:transposase